MQRRVRVVSSAPVANPATANTETLKSAFLRLAEGDRSAADEVFAALWPRLVRFCRRAVSAADAEDCAQRALMTLFERAPTFDPERSPLAWAYTLAAWECRSVRRSAERRREESEGIEAAEDGELAVAERDLVRRALALVEGMSDLDRDTLYADLMEERAGSATHRQRRHRMLARLRDAWRTLYGPE